MLILATYKIQNINNAYGFVLWPYLMHVRSDNFIYAVFYNQQEMCHNAADVRGFRGYRFTRFFSTKCVLRYVQFMLENVEAIHIKAKMQE